MFNALKTTFSRLRKDEKGVTLVEYGIALTLAVVVGGTALGLLGDEVTAEMGDAQSVMAATTP